MGKASLVQVPVQALVQILVYTLVLIPVAVNASQLDAQINQLIDRMGESDCGFVRNGSTYSAYESMKHVRKKYVHFKPRIHSLDDFIELSATRSLISGKRYKVQCGEQARLPAAQWMQEQILQLGIES